MFSLVPGTWMNVRERLSLVPRAPPFYLPFAFTIIHGSVRPAKNGEGLGAFIT